jgi:hypothetical protein
MLHTRKACHTNRRASTRKEPNTHTHRHPIPRGNTLLNTVWKGVSSCAAIHTPKTGAVPERHLLYTRLPQGRAPGPNQEEEGSRDLMKKKKRVLQGSHTRLRRN